MHALRLRYDPHTLWSSIWQDVDVDAAEFIDMSMYPIHPTINYLEPEHRILECGFGAGRVYRHLRNHGYDQVFGIEYDHGATVRVNQTQPGALATGDVTQLPFADGSFDRTLAFGVIGGMGSAFARSLNELIRVTNDNGLLLVSVMPRNLSRRIQYLVNQLSQRHHDEHFYAWMDSRSNWTALLEAYDLEVVDSSLMLSRYNLYFWLPMLRKRGVVTDLARARVDDRAYQLSAFGEALHQLSTRLLPYQFAGAILFVCRKIAHSA